MLHARRPAAITAFLALCATTVLSAQDDPDRAVAGGGAMPAGWHARTDRDAPLASVKFVVMGSGYHVTLGPAAILWRDADTASGDYTAETTFSQSEPPRHREGYGMFIGGSDLAGPAQRYTYFLIAGNGQFLVKRRFGDSTAVVSGSWADNAAIKKTDSAGNAQNTLTIRVANGKASFRVNGTEVYVTDAANVDVKGIVGYRINHNLNIHLDPIAITR
jgi:hypothetical protein